MKIRSAAALGAALLVLSIAAFACGGDDDNGDEGDGTQPAATSTRAATAEPAAEDTEEPAAETAEPAATATTAAPAPTTAPAPTAAPSVDTVNVSADDFAFSPNAITINGANDTAFALANSGATPHSMKVYSDAGYSSAVADADTDIVSAGGSGGFTLTSVEIGGATQLFFRCEVHPAQMEGTIAVD